MYVVTHVKTHGFSYEVLFICETMDKCWEEIFTNLDLNNVKGSILRSWLKGGITRVDYGSHTGYYEIHEV